MINLKRFTETKEVILPIISGWGQINSRKVYQQLDDGWYRADIGDQINIIRKATPLEVDRTLSIYHPWKMYALGEEGIPTDFESMNKLGIKEATKVNFLNLGIFEVAKVAQWEDKRFYFIEADSSYQRSLLKQVKEVFDKDQTISLLKGLTPELRYYFLLLNLQRQSYRQLKELEAMKLSEAEREKRIKEFQNSFSGRLKYTIEQAGGTLVKFFKSGKGYMIHWKIGDQLVKSTIRDDLRIINAGFCLSGDDKEHSIASIVQLAKMFQEDKPLFITRD